MHDDDQPIGRIMKRRELLAFLGVAGAAGTAFLAGCSGDEAPPGTGSASTPSAQGGANGAASTPGTGSGGAAVTSTPAAASAPVPSCVVVPEATVGPYFADLKLNRSDIRGEPNGGGNRPGVPLVMTVNVSRVASNACQPLAGALVDVWHCDAAGIYSAFQDGGNDARSLAFLRGQQTTDVNGQVKFTTIYPGWYQGRAIHIHFKIRSGNSEFTSQWFFEEAITNQVYAQQPYASKGLNYMKNAQDGIFRGTNNMLTLAPTRSGDSYTVNFDIGITA